MRWEDLVARVGVIQLDLIKTSGFTSCLKKYNENKDASTLNELVNVLKILGNRQPLPEKYDGHPMQGQVKKLLGIKGIKNCHVQGDRVLLYKIEGNGFILYRFGPHSQITEQRLGNHRNRFPLDERFL